MLYSNVSEKCEIAFICEYVYKYLKTAANAADQTI